MAAESGTFKLLPVFVLVITTSVSITLLSISKHTFAGPFSDFVSNNRAVVGIVVQVCASLLAAAQVYVLCAIINFAARVRVYKQFVGLSILKLFSALSASRLDWTLSWHYFPAAALLVALGPGFGAIWAGALTPLITHDVRQDGTIEVPHYSGPLKKTWSIQDDSSIKLHCHVNTESSPEFQLVSDCPAVDSIGGLVASAQTATNPQGKPRTHSKLENAVWTYSRRSYGAGSSQGLYVPSKTSTDPYTAYSYQELGYRSNVTCIHNSSSNISVKPAGYGDGILKIWVVNGSLPNMAPDGSLPYHVTTLPPNGDPFTWSAAAVDGKNMLATASKGWYRQWDKIQCSITFTPTLFSVTVNLTQFLIQVMPDSTAEEFEPSGSLISITMANLGLISRMSSNVVASQLGNAVKYNTVNVNARSPGLSRTGLAERALEDSVTAIIDDLLVAQGSAQMAIFNHSTPRTVEKYFKAVQVGKARFSTAMVMINILLVLLFISEACRTTFWLRLPSFNFTNIEAVILAALNSPGSHSFTSYDSYDDAKLGTSESESTVESSEIRVKWQCSRDGRLIMICRPPRQVQGGGHGVRDVQEVVSLASTKQSRVLEQFDKFGVVRKPLSREDDYQYSRLVDG